MDGVRSRPIESGKARGYRWGYIRGVWGGISGKADRANSKKRRAGEAL